MMMNYHLSRACLLATSAALPECLSGTAIGCTTWNSLQALARLWEQIAPSANPLTMIWASMQADVWGTLLLRYSRTLSGLGQQLRSSGQRVEVP